MNISADKFKIIRTIKFSPKCKNFEIYIGLTKYFRNYVSYYAQFVKLL